MLGRLETSGGIRCANGEAAKTPRNVIAAMTAM
jgi:hypothetical protein